MDESGHDYGDCLYEEEKPTDALEDAVDLDDGDNELEYIMRETSVKPLDLNIADDLHGMLIREAKAEALRRYEEAAQSPDEFMAVVATWDKLDANRERRERYNETLCGDGILEYSRSSEGLVFPQWMMDATYRQLSRGNILDYLFDCPYEMHNLTGRAYLRKIVDEMKEDHKEIFFFLYLRQYSPQQLAALRGQTDRNIRKVRDVLLRKIRSKVYNELKRLNKHGYTMSGMEYDFYCRYEETEGKAK